MPTITPFLWFDAPLDEPISKYGLSWQVIPEALTRHLNDKDRARSQRVVQVMRKMKKIEVAALDRAAAAG
jgi:hypothetical protein